MEAVFLKLVNLSLTAGIMILAVLAFRLIFRKAPKWLFCLLWGLVALRLVIPFSIESVFSLIPSAEPLPADIITTASPKIDSGIPAINNAVNPVISSVLTPEPFASANPTQIWSAVLSWIWVGGLAVIICYAIISTVLLKRKLRMATPYEKGIKQSEVVESPFVLGIIRPVIYLPYKIADGDLIHVIAHEQAHIQRKDHWWKPLGFLILSVYWFNPMIWLAYILLCRDIEAACDEKVIGTMDKDTLRAYSTALLNCSVNRRRIAACPIAFGEVGVKERVKNVMNYKKPAFWIIAVAVVACIAVSVCFLTNPKAAPDKGGKVTDIQTHVPDSEKLSLTVVANNLHNDKPSITVEWKNLDKNNFKYGYEYCVYEYQDGQYFRMPENDSIVTGLVLRELFPGGTDQHKYDLSMFAFEKGISYRLYLNSFEPNEYWIDFIYEQGLSDNGTEPPSMYVTDGNSQIKATIGTYQWTYQDTNTGNTVIKNADCAGFDTMKERLSVLTTVPKTVSYKKSNEVTLTFTAAQPQKILVSYLDNHEWKKLEVTSEFSFELAEGSYIYQVEADFGSNGCADYGFIGKWNIPSFNQTLVLTKDNVVELSKKGENLTWGDLKDFKHGEDIGSGLYIVVYEIDETYELMVGGGAPIDEEHPSYAYLKNKKTEQRINIMKEDPTEFIK